MRLIFNVIHWFVYFSYFILGQVFISPSRGRDMIFDMIIEYHPNKLSFWYILGGIPIICGTFW